MFKQFKWFIKKYQKKYIFAITFLLLSDLLGLIPPYITGYLTDAIFTKFVAINVFLGIILLDFIVILVKYLISIGWRYFVFRASDEIGFQTRDRLMDKLLRQSLKFYESNSTGSLMGKATNDVYSITDLAGYGTLGLFDSTVFPLCIIIVMIFVVDLKLTLFAILPLPLLAYLFIRIGDKIYQRWDRVQMAFDRLNDNVLEDVEGIRIIRVYNLQKARNRLFQDRGYILYLKNMEVVRFQALITPVQRIIPAISFIIAIGYGSYLISQGVISVGKLVSFTYYLNMLVWPMYAFGDFINIKQQAIASMERIQEVLDYPEDIVDKSNAIELKENPAILFEKYSFKYPTSKNNVLDQITLSIPEGSSLGILGKTGSGKSTLLKQILNIYPKISTTMYLNKLLIDEYRTKSIRNWIGYVPQEHMIFSKTIRENIKFGNRDATEKELWNAVQLADFEKDVNSFHDGLNTLCGEKGVSLSGGQKQRIAIARAMIKDPELLIMDDCMSALDATTEKNIMSNIRSKRQGKTTILATHRISQIKDFDQIIVLREGKIIERGTHQELLRNDSWYKQQYITQLTRSRYEEE